MKTFTQWMTELRELAVEEWGFSENQARDTIDNNWIPFFENRLSPSDALSEVLKF